MFLNIYLKYLFEATSQIQDFNNLPKHSHVHGSLLMVNGHMTCKQIQINVLFKYIYNLFYYGCFYFKITFNLKILQYKKNFLGKP